MQRLHPVFPVIKLRKAENDPIPGRRQPPPPNPELVEGEERWEVEEILDSCLTQNRFQYLVSWKGFRYEHNSWEDEKDVHAPEEVQYGSFIGSIQVHQGKSERYVLVN
jgi:hypothetical protein